jgi:hypothetical protein
METRDLYKSLRERIYQLRMGHLFEEPGYESGYDSDCRMTYDYDDEDGDPIIYL